MKNETPRKEERKTMMYSLSAARATDSGLASGCAIQGAGECRGDRGE